MLLIVSVLATAVAVAAIVVVALTGTGWAVVMALIAAVAATSGARYVDIAGSTGPAFRRHPDRYFAGDRYHPSDAGYALWARAVLAVLGHSLRRH